MLLWIGFLILITIFLALDLGVFHKKSHVISAGEALRWTTLWISLSLAFSGAIYFLYSRGLVDNPLNLSGGEATITYLTGYAIEYSLSLDNIFVIALIFTYFRVPREYQHRVLFWGIIGSVVLRAIMIVAGVMLINQFTWMTIVFGLLLLYSAYRMLRSGEEEVDPRKNPAVKMVRRIFPITADFHGDKFFVKRKYITAGTPLFVALIVVETTDILFAIDSIPAILAITTDPFLVFSSNIFAILGLRSLYFVLSSMLDKFGYLKYSLIFILAFVGVKMLLVHYIHLPQWLSLGLILTAMGTGIIASIVKDRKRMKEKEKLLETEKM
jgi:tellurite resistance protein TerC